MKIDIFIMKILFEFIFLYSVTTDYVSGIKSCSITWLFLGFNLILLIDSSKVFLLDLGLLGQAGLNF